MIIVKLLFNFFMLYHPFISEVDGDNLIQYINGKKVLLFGDSYTSGAYVPNYATSETEIQFHPYYIEIRRILGNDTDFIISGIQGDTTHHMLSRLGIVLESNPDIGLVIILGGTNDLAKFFSRSTIQKNLESLHHIALTFSKDLVYTIAISIPETKYILKNRKLSLDRTRVNNHLSLLSKHCPHRIGFVDTDSKINLSSFNISNVQKKFWSIDKVHLSEKGYDVLGKMIYDVMDNFQVIDSSLEFDSNQFHSCKKSYIVS